MIDRDKEIDGQEILKELRNIIGEQAQQIAMLKAAITMLSNSDPTPSSVSK